MNRLSNTLIILGIIFFLALIGNPFFILYEGKQAIITQFGKPVGGAITDAGLHLKIPFIHKVNYFEARVLEWDGYPNQIPTKDKRYIWVDTTARWKIKEPLKFFQSVYDERGAHARLDDIVDSALRDAVTSQILVEIVRSSNRIIEELKPQEGEGIEFIEEGALEEIRVGRDAMREEIVKRARETVSEYGIELLDVRIKRINYVEEVRRKVYERMIAERKRAAEKYRSEGRGTRAEIEGKTDKELKGIISTAYKKAQGIKGEADASAAKIYADAYNRDPELFSLLKTLDTYKNTVDENTTVLLTTDSEYLKYLSEISPKNSQK
ncbi:MAG: protease modulator HflC [Candidatus Omnitrophota bacterium]|nr:MAG: protease modulator HflC [Candidatus Omnitrophota bacterium]